MLHFDGAADRIHDTAKLDARAVTGALDDAPVKRGDGRVDEVAAQTPEARERPILVGAGEPAITDDIRNQDRRELASLGNWCVSRTGARLAQMPPGALSIRVNQEWKRALGGRPSRGWFSLREATPSVSVRVHETHRFREAEAGRASMNAEIRIATLDVVHGFMKTQIACAVASLSIADHLAAGPLSLAALVEKTGANPDGLRRLVRAAASLGLIRAEAEDLFASTPMLDAFRSDAPASLRAIAIMYGSPNHWRPWGRLTEAVRTGAAQTVAALGCSGFDYLAANPDEAVFFAKAMQSITESVQAEVVRLLDTKGVARAADIGGANGALVLALAAANPRSKASCSTCRMRSRAQPP